MEPNILCHNIYQSSLVGHCVMSRPHDVANLTSIKVAEFLCGHDALSVENYKRLLCPANRHDFRLLLTLIEGSSHCSWGDQNDFDEGSGTQQLILPPLLKRKIETHIHNLDTSPIKFSKAREIVRQLSHEIWDYYKIYSARLNKLEALPPIKLRRPLGQRFFSSEDLLALMELISSASTVIFRSFPTPDNVERTQLTSTFEYDSDWLVEQGNRNEDLLSLAKKHPGTHIPTLLIEERDFQALEREYERLNTTGRCTLC